MKADEAIRLHFPFKSRYFKCGPADMHYVDEGPPDGDPVVMVHGNPTWSFYFRSLIAALRSTHRCIAMDHIGCGLSDKPDDDHYEYVLEQRVHDLEALLDHLELDRNITLIVHDWGGMIGMAWALRRPERIARLVVLNTAAFLLPPGKPLPRRLRLLRRGPLGPLLIRGFNAFARGAARMAPIGELSPDVRKAYLAPYNSWRNRIATLRFVQDIPLTPDDASYDAVKLVEDNLHKLAGLPMLICWGEQDFVFDGDFLAEWRRRFPDAEVHTFPNAGHYVLEDAGKEIVRLVRGFLGGEPRE